MRSFKRTLTGYAQNAYKTGVSSLRRTRLARAGFIVEQRAAKELITLLYEDDWLCVRQKGSHRQYRHPSKPGTVTVAGKLSIEIPPGTLSSILKLTGLKK